jgi:hypothetical protein
MDSGAEEMKIATSNFAWRAACNAIYEIQMLFLATKFNLTTILLDRDCPSQFVQVLQTTLPDTLSISTALKFALYLFLLIGNFIIGSYAVTTL